ncbi:MAG: type IV pilus twitching motility protein PilT [bacterium]|nr:type IV pilus twitching motility protein PilT [bacterium]
MHIDDLLRMVVQRDASDLHLRAGEPPILRIHGDLKRTDLPRLTAEDVKNLLYAILNEERKQRFERDKELDLSYEVPGLARFRVNMYWQQRCVGAALRLIPFRIRTIDELMMPPAVKELSMRPRGLFLVTGPTGSGKSTSLAAMIDHINTHKRCHIMTIEDPIEYMHHDKLSIINQRELGVDTHSFADALRHVMRQNPDVILVGEMRDLETIHLAITAAETGHLVMSTVHTQDAPQTIDRIVDVFPPEQQQQIRMQLSVVLVGVLSQTLLPNAQGTGRVAAFELMVATPSVRNLIREGKTHQIYSIMETSAQQGMQTMDRALADLHLNGLVSFEEAVLRCIDRENFMRFIKAR